MKTVVKKELTHKECCFGLVLKFYDYLNLSCHNEKEISDFFLEGSIIPWKRLMKEFPSISINTLFRSVLRTEISAWVNKAKKSNSFYQSPDFFSYYVITWSKKINQGNLIRSLLRNKNVELAYFLQGPLHPPSSGRKDPFITYQQYLNAAPEGIDAKYAWGIKGGEGNKNIRLVDIEQGWILDHEDIVVNAFQNSGINCDLYKDHGTAVLGIILMQENQFGGKGITPNISGHIISQWRPDGSFNTADAIMAAIAHLKFGDIILIEAQTSLTNPPDKMWPIETEDAVYHVIRLATALGIIVIEPAGNGNLSGQRGNNLDLFSINNKKVFDPKSPDFRDSGAIMVAAASATTPLKRIEYSNYGKRINCFACGEHVMTAGNYPGSSRSASNMYTWSFGGTSSASAIIAGAAASIQSISATNRGLLLDAIQMRSILSSESYGTDSPNGHTKDRIGVMPDLKNIITNAFHVQVHSNRIAQHKKSKSLKKPDLIR